MSDEYFDEYGEQPDEEHLDEYCELDTDIEEADGEEDDNEEANDEENEINMNFLDKINRFQDGIQNYKNGLDRMLKNREISKDDYYNELIQVEEFEIELNKQQNQIALTDAGLELIEKLNSQREELRKNLATISIEDYNKQMLLFIKQEKQIINDYQVIISKAPKVDKLKSLPFIEKINELIKREEKIVKSLAKNLNIKLNKPKSNDPLYETKIIEYNKNFNYIQDYYLPGYKISLINPTSINPPNWELNYDPTLNSIKSLKKTEIPLKLIKDFEKSKYGSPDLTRQPLVKDTTFIKNQFVRKIPVVNSIGVSDLLDFIKLKKKVSLKGKNLTEIAVKIGKDDIDTYRPFIETLKKRKLETLGRYKEPFYGKYIADIKDIEINQQKVTIEFNDFIKYTVDTSNIEFFPLIKVDIGLSHSIPKDDITFIYTLNKETNIKLFVNFKDYIQEIKKNLISNINDLKDDSSIESAKFKIDQINYYIENDDFMSSEHILSSKDQSIRKEGIEKLIGLFSQYKEYSEDKVRELEAQVAIIAISYDLFNKETYKFIIDKIYFISIQYSELILDYLLARIPSTLLINFEVPKNFPDDFTYKPSFLELSPKEKFDKLLEWEPNTINYYKYKNFIEEGDTIEAIDEKLTNSNIFLDYGIVREIYLEFREKIAWDTFRRNIHLVKIPEFKNEFLWKFRILNQKRNTLPSMRIYQVATITERIGASKNIEIALINCKLPNSNSVATIIEKIIFEKSKTDTQYKDNIISAIKNYDNFCHLLDENDGVDLDTIINNIVALTEYFMNGKTASKYKIQQIIKAIKEQNIVDLENILSSSEIELINSIFIELRDKKLERERIREKTKNNESKLEVPSSVLNKLTIKYEDIKQTNINDYILELNKFIKPTVSNIKPSNDIKFIYIDGKYIYGGYYPPLKNQYGNYNYTKDDLIELNKIFGFKVKFGDKIGDIYRDFIENLNSIDQQTDIPNIKNNYKDFNLKVKLILFSSFFSKLNDKVKQQDKLNNYLDEIYKYVKPTVSSEKPSYGIRFVYSNGRYIYGGYYPSLRGPSGNYNYTNEDLIELVKIFGFDIQLDNQMEDIYSDLMSKLNKLPEDRNVTILEHKSYLIDTTKDYKDLNIQNKTMFCFRKLDGYPEPGAPYKVFKEHFDLSYCVPLYYKNNIPVYSIKHKELADSKIAIIEGPAIFENTKVQSAVSEYYCLIEQLDHRGAKIYFKEGVYRDKIKYSNLKEVSTCSSYKTKEDCLNPFSMSLDGSKCTWLDNRCVKLEQVREPSRDIWFWDTEDLNIKDKWFLSLSAIREEVIDIINNGRIMYLHRINKLIDEYSKKLEDIKVSLEEESKQIIMRDPSNKPDNHYLQVMTKKQIEEAKIAEKNSMAKITFDYPYIKELLNRKLHTNTLDIPDGYLSIEIPTYSIRYVDKYKQFKTKGGKLKLKGIISDNKIPENREITRTIIMAYITKEDKILLDNPPASFFWFIKSPEYTYIDQSVTTANVTKKVKYIPLQKIVPTDKVPNINLPLITKDDIKRAILSVAFSTLIDSDGMLIDDIIFDAEPDALSFCMDNNINPIDITNGVKKLTLDLTIQYFESKKIKTVSLDEKIRNSLERAIRQKNIDLLKSLIGQIKLLKDEIDAEILKFAEDAYREIIEEKEQNEKLASDIQIKLDENKKVSEESAKTKEKDIIKKFNKSINSTSSKLARRSKKL